MPQNREVLRAIADPVSHLILIHGDVQTPMQTVFDGPMRARDLAEPVRSHGRAQQIVSGLRRRLLGRLADPHHLANGRQSRPVMDRLNHSISVESMAVRVSMRPWS